MNKDLYFWKWTLGIPYYQSARPENVVEVGPYPAQLKLDKTVTPLTETATVPPFQPSPHVSVLCMVCKHD